MSTIYQLTRDTICTAAISKLGVLARGQVPDAEDLSKASMALNMLVSLLRTKGLPLWSRKDYVLTLQPGVGVYTFGVGKTINIAYPLKLLDCYTENIVGNTRIAIDIISKQEYNVLPKNMSSSIPVKVSYQPLVNYGELSVWPIPDSSTTANYKVVVTYQKPFEYFSVGTDMMDFPEEYYLPIVYKLATLLAPEWGIPLEDRRQLQIEAKEYLDMVDSFGEEDGSFFFYPDRNR